MKFYKLTLTAIFTLVSVNTYLTFKTHKLAKVNVSSVLDVPKTAPKKVEVGVLGLIKENLAKRFERIVETPKNHTRMEVERERLIKELDELEQYNKDLDALVDEHLCRNLGEC